MQAAIETREDGSIAIEFDQDAARTMLASIVFAARFHEGIAPLSGMIKASFQRHQTQPVRRTLCQ